MRTYKIPQTLALLALSVLAGCSGDGTEATDALADDSRLIRFTMAGTDGATTRTASAYAGATFQVLADHTTDNPATNESSWTAYMPDQTATKISSEWKTSTSYYLPASGTLRFYAYAGGLSPNSRSAGSAPTFNVTDQETIQTDLLTYTTDLAHNDPGTVPIQFSHAMAAVWFSIKNGSMSGTVSNITIPAVNNSGTYTIGGSGTGWSGLGSSTDYVVAYSSHNTYGNSLLLIPQDLSGKEVTIQFTPTGGSQTNLTATLPTLNLQPGYRYNLQLEISTDLKITNTISPWDTTAPAINENVALSYPPAVALPGLFSVAANKKVYFSQGNLQYQASTSTWRFAEHQYDYVGDGTNGTVSGSNNASISSSYDGWIDLFGWGTSGKSFASGYGSANQPTSTSTTYSDYGPTGGTFGLTGTYADGDWGVNMGSGWRTLTGGSGGEWEWILGPSSSPNPDTNCRRSSTIGSTVNARYVKATVHSAKGVIIFPDEITWNITTMGTAPTTCNTANNAFTYSPSDENWTALESAGCVFLPAAGYRNGTSVNNVGSIGIYWSSTACDADRAYNLRIYSSGLNPANYSYRCNGISVRLVRQVE